MNEMISIDFGNTYTKVAVRTGLSSPSKLLTDKGIKSDILNACVPTVAAVLETSTRSGLIGSWPFAGIIGSEPFLFLVRSPGGFRDESHEIHRF